MGTTSSAPQALTQEQQDVKYLGERMPFGDEELYRVYRAYRAMKSKSPEERISFLTDIGVQSVPPPQQQERSILLQAVEHKLLPPNLGNRLYEAAFLKSAADSEYTTMNNKGAVMTTTTKEDDSYSRMVKLEAFFDGLSNCTRRGNQKALKVLFECCQPQTPEEASSSVASTGAPPPPVDFAYAASSTKTDESSSVVVDPMELVIVGFRVGLASGFLCATNKEDSGDVGRFFPDDDQMSSWECDDSGLKALAESLVAHATLRKQRLERSSSMTRSKFVTEEEVQEWAEQVAPMFGSSLATLAHMVFFPDRPFPPTRTSFDYPSLAEFTSAFVSKGSSSLLFSFGCMSPSLGGEYYRLYTSASDGLSFNRLQNALLGYGGPTLIIIQSGDCLFGAFTASPWKESKDFYGSHDCFLYQLLPKTAIYRPSGNASNFMYCNSFARSRGYDQQAHGIGFGGTVEQPRLFLAESFDNCRAAAQDMTFESGRLLDHQGTEFQIENLEVWGVGGTEVVQEALGARSRQRDIKRAAIQKARKVDKAQFLDDFRSGLIESKAFQHRDQIRGRDGAVVDDEDINNYK